MGRDPLLPEAERKLIDHRLEAYRRAPEAASPFHEVKDPDEVPAEPAEHEMIDRREAYDYFQRSLLLRRAVPSDARSCVTHV